MPKVSLNFYTRILIDKADLHHTVITSQLFSHQKTTDLDSVFIPLEPPAKRLNAEDSALREEPDDDTVEVEL